MFLFFTVYGSFFVTCCHGWLAEVCERDHCFPIRHRLFPLERFCDFFCPVLPDKRKRKITGSKSENIRIQYSKEAPAAESLYIRNVSLKHVKSKNFNRQD